MPFGFKRWHTSKRYQNKKKMKAKERQKKIKVYRSKSERKRQIKKIEKYNELSNKWIGTILTKVKETKDHTTMK